MIIKVIKYNEIQDYHECIDSNGMAKQIDLLVDGAFEGVTDKMTKEESLKFLHSFAGRKFEIESLDTYLYLGVGVKEITTDLE